MTDDLESNHTAILRDIRNNGGPDETSTYGYTNVGSDGHANELSNHNQDQDIADPAATALLESLLGFDQTVPAPSNGSEHSAGDSLSNDVPRDHFASLLQAVATAGAAHQNNPQPREASELPPRPEGSFFRRSFPPEPAISNPHISKATPAEEQDENKGDFGFTRHGTKRRKVQRQDRDALAREREIWGSDYEEDSGDQGNSPNSKADSGVAGLQSAAALFRKPSAASKKYARPVMSKMFTSLELSPEMFVHIQAAAKAFMLDDNHPDRFTCIGDRGDKGQTDLTKLKLFECAQEFLEDEGWGERCYGVNSPDAESKKVKWPAMKNKIIALMIPLLRRMVSNERQRRYAIEARKEKALERGTKTRVRQREQEAGNSSDNTSQPPIQHTHSPTVDEMDPRLNHYHYTVDSTNYLAGRDATPTPHNGRIREGQLPSVESDDGGIKYQVNLMKNVHRIKPKFTLTPTSCPGFASLVQYIQSIMDDGDHTLKSVKVLGPGGLVDVINEETWMGVIGSIKDCEWMDGDVKCVAQVEEAPEIF